MKYQVDCTGWSKEQLWEIFMTLPQHANVKVVLFWDEDKAAAKISHEKLVGKYLNNLGIPRHLNGYNYLKYSVARCLSHPEELESVTKLLYPAVAKEFQTTSGRVEHGIRHAIQKTCENERTTEWENIFGKNYACCYQKPTNSQFIAALSDFIRLNVTEG